VKKASKKLHLGYKKVAKSCTENTQKRLEGVFKTPFLQRSKKRVYKFSLKKGVFFEN
jgi:hypothetical protein